MGTYIVAPYKPMNNLINFTDGLKPGYHPHIIPSGGLK